MAGANEHIHTDFQEGFRQKGKKSHLLFLEDKLIQLQLGKGATALYICKTVCLTLQSPAMYDSGSFCGSLKISDLPGHLKHKNTP